VGYGGADGAWDCGCGAAKVADDGEQDCGGVVATVVKWRRSQGNEMRLRESVNEVEEGSWMCCGNKKGTSEMEQLLAACGATWRLRATAARLGGAEGGQQRSGKRRAGELEGQVVRLKQRGAAGSAGARR
jgi:hypothetical protein